MTQPQPPAPDRFDGRVAVVTGGSGGIGAAVCSRLVRAGAVVYCLYKSNDAAASRLQDSLGADGERLRARRVDVTDGDALEATFEAIEHEQRRLDILVNCAGATYDGLLLRTSLERVRASLAINLESAIAASRCALRPMLKARFGRIVSIGSVVASVGNAGQAVYAAAKAGLEGFTRSLAREVGSRGITVNCVAPGYIGTAMSASMDDRVREKAIAATALGRPGTPEEVAHAVAFLCSDEAAYVTGTVLQVNGGMYM